MDTMLRITNEGEATTPTARLSETPKTPRNAQADPLAAASGSKKTKARKINQPKGDPVIEGLMMMRKPRTTREALQEYKIKKAVQAIDDEIAELQAVLLVSYQIYTQYKDEKGRKFEKAKIALKEYATATAQLEKWRKLRRETYKDFFKTFAKWKGQLYAGIVTTYLFVNTDWKYIAAKYKVSTAIVVEAISDYHTLSKRAKRIAKSLADNL